MKTIQVSATVFAKIWSLRKPGEDTEDEVLMRVLDCSADQPSGKDRPAKPKNDPTPYVDSRFNVSFVDGFEIFRTFKGIDYKAVFSGGGWILNGKRYPSVGQLSWVVTKTNENAWRRWMFRRSDGQVRPIDELRDQSRVIRRLAVEPIDMDKLLEN